MFPSTPDYVRDPHSVCVRVCVRTFWVPYTLGSVEILPMWVWGWFVSLIFLEPHSVGVGCAPGSVESLIVYDAGCKCSLVPQIMLRAI